MRLLRVELEDFETGNMHAIIPVEDLTVIIGRNNVGKSLILEWIERMLTFEPELERKGRGEAPRYSGGWAHIRLALSDSPSSDWPWFRKLLVNGIPGDIDSDIPDLASVLGGPELFESDADYEEWLADTDLTEEEDTSWQVCRARIVSALSTNQHMSLLASLLLLLDDALTVAVQLFPGGMAEIVADMSNGAAPAVPEAIVHHALNHSELTPRQAEIFGTLLSPVAANVRTIRLGCISQRWDDMQILMSELPDVVRIRDTIADPERQVDATINQTIKSAPLNSRLWIEDGPDGSARLRQDVITMAQRISARANELLPPFVADLGSLQIEVERISSWSEDVPHSSVRWQFTGQDSWSHFTMLGAGTRRWIAASLEAACRDMVSARSGHAQPLYLVDEPEMHLHPSAQTEVLAWIEARVGAGATAVLATHSPLILNSTRESSTLIALVRHGLDLTQVDISASVLEDLGAIDGLGEVLGVDRIAALQLTRGILVVEGEHDRTIIRRFFGPELDRARIRLLPIRGTGNAKALADSELFASLGVPICIMFDEVSDLAIAARETGATLSPEEKKMIELLDAMNHHRRSGQRVAAAAFNLPDIICALPMTAVRRAFPSVRISIQWSAITDEWRSRPTERRPGYKSYALKELGLSSIPVDDFVDSTVRAITPTDMPAAELARAIKTAQAQLLGNSDEMHA